MTRLIRASWVIARRDFTATVLSKAFIFFLLGPLFPLLLGGLFGGIGARVASQTGQPMIAAVMTDADYQRLAAARERLVHALPGQPLLRFVHHRPEGDPRAQHHRLLAERSPAIRAVLSGSIDRPKLIAARHEPAIAGQVSLILEAAREPPPPPVEVGLVPAGPGPASLAADRAITAQIGQMLLFFLTILLSGMLLSQLVEEKSSKIVEVIAAAVPVEALFLGKLFAMLAASVLGILVWVGAGAVLVQMMKSGGVATLPPPALGWSGFILLAILYFAANYLLLGALFLTIGAQASSVREVQTLSMPVTFAQVLIFGFASVAIGNANAPESIAAAVFPFSSPMAMLARAAEEPGWWPHLLALAWQLLWVALILHWGARLFRKTVLKSGPPVRWWRRRRRA